MKSEKKQPKTLYDCVRGYLRRGWQTVPIRPRSKNPRHIDWTALRISEDEIGRYFQEDDNVGLLLGAPSGGLTDVDLDAPQAVALASSSFLPKTSRTHGRPSRPKSHLLYVADPVPAPMKFKDSDGACLVELRSRGQQTVVPPSIHPSGERISWVQSGQPGLVDGGRLHRCVARLASCALVARHWPATGARHEASMALAGLLLRNGWSKTSTIYFISRAARIAGDEEWRLREPDVRSTIERLERGLPATGIPTLTSLIGAEVVKRLEDWLQLNDLKSAENSFSRVAPWPDPLNPEALYGLAGDFVRAIEPHSESDPAALLFQFNAVIGNVIGRGPHFVAEADRHGCNLFVCVVGATAKGRKGSSWSHIRRAGKGVDREWEADRIQQGLSSGEGLIWAVRDPITRSEPIRKKGKVVGYQEVIADHGVEDKRLLVVEPEFASVLRNLAREGNTLSPTLRQGWDTGLLHILTKNSPAKASGAHISVIGHVTRDELRRYLTSTELGNGFANRFLWVCARRSKSLPEGGQVDEWEMTVLIDRIRDAIAFARQIRKMSRSDKARRLWFQVYEELSEGKPGLLGAAVSRGEAQVMRLASIYALLDCSPVVKAVHLRAALALWKYAEQSARFIFGDSLGDPMADDLLRALRKSPEGLTRTQIRDLFDRNRRAEEIERALGGLLENGLIQRQVEETAGRGRPSERWIAAGALRTTITTNNQGEK